MYTSPLSRINFTPPPPHSTVYTCYSPSNPPISKDQDNSHLLNQISILNGMNQAKENYIQELETKLHSLTPTPNTNSKGYNRLDLTPLANKDNNLTFIERKRALTPHNESRDMITMKDAKKMFEHKEKIQEKEFDDLRKRIAELNFIKESLRNAEMEKNLIESSLKIHKINMNELETKLEVLNDENLKLMNQLKKKQTEKDEELNSLEKHLREEFELQRKEIENKLEKILSENEKLILFNNKLFAENQKISKLNQEIQKAHEEEFEEFKKTFKNTFNDNSNHLKNNEIRILESRLARQKDLLMDIEKKVSEHSKENSDLRFNLASKEDLISQLESKLTLMGDKEGIVKLIENERNELSNKNEDSKQIIKQLNEKIKGINDERDVLRQKYDRIAENYEKYVEESKVVAENRKNRLIESEFKKKTQVFESELISIKSQFQLLEAEKTALDEHLSFQKNENLRINQKNHEFISQINNSEAERKNLMNEITDLKGIIEQNNEMIANLQTDLNAKASCLNEKQDLLENKNNSLCNYVNNLLGENEKLNQNLENSLQNVEIYRSKLMALQQNMDEQLKETKNYGKEQILSLEMNLAKAKEEMKDLNNIQGSLGSKIAELSEENNRLKLNLEREIREKIEIGGKISIIEENHQIQLQEFSENIRKTEFGLRQKEEIELRFNRELAEYKEALNKTRESLNQYQNTFNSQSNEKKMMLLENDNLRTKISELEINLSRLKDLITSKDQSIVDLQFRTNELSQEIMHINHSKDKQNSDLTAEYHRVIDHCEFLQSTCQREHILTIENLKINLKNMENDLFNERIRMNYDKTIAMNIKNHMENEYYNEKRRNNFEKNLDLNMKNIEIDFYNEKRRNDFDKNIDMNIKNLDSDLYHGKRRPALESIENRRWGGRGLSLDKRGDEKNTIVMLKENEMINAQILKRCREIVGR